MLPSLQELDHSAGNSVLSTQQSDAKLHRLGSADIRYANHPAFSSLPRAFNNTPPGYRSAQLSEELTDAARKELEEWLSPTRFTLEMNVVYHTAVNGMKRRAHPPERFPACLALMREAEKALSLRNRDLAHVQVMVRQYQKNKRLALHIDNINIFDEPVLSVVLRCGSTSSMLLRKPGYSLNESTTYIVVENPGLASCLEGSARYEFGHEIPPVLESRLSLTWRWFKPEAFQKLNNPPLKKKSGSTTRSTIKELPSLTGTKRENADAAKDTLVKTAIGGYETIDEARDAAAVNLAMLSLRTHTLHGPRAARGSDRAIHRSGKYGRYAGNFNRSNPSIAENHIENFATTCGILDTVLIFMGIMIGLVALRFRLRSSIARVRLLT